MSTERSSNQAPVMRFRDYPVEVAVWQEQRHDEKSGKDFTASSFKLSKSFKTDKTKSGYDQRDITLYPDDILRAIALLQAAYNFAVIQVKSSSET